jgi:hypothetical protein
MTDAVKIVKEEELSDDYKAFRSKVQMFLEEKQSEIGSAHVSITTEDSQGMKSSFAISVKKQDKYSIYVWDFANKAPEFKETLTEAPSNEYLYSLIEA